MNLLLEAYRTAKDQRDPAALAVFLGKAMAEHKINISGLAGILCISLPTLRSWRKGQTLPSSPDQWKALKLLAEPNKATSAQLERARAAVRPLGRPSKQADSQVARNLESVLGRLAKKKGWPDEEVNAKVGELVKRAPRTVRFWREGRQEPSRRVLEQLQAEAV